MINFIFACIGIYAMFDIACMLLKCLKFFASAFVLLGRALSRPDPTLIGLFLSLCFLMWLAGEFLVYQLSQT